jgi:hypothetical protein
MEHEPDCRCYKCHVKNNKNSRDSRDNRDNKNDRDNKNINNKNNRNAFVSSERYFNFLAEQSSDEEDVNIKSDRVKSNKINEDINTYDRYNSNSNINLNKTKKYPPSFQPYNEFLDFNQSNYNSDDNNTNNNNNYIVDNNLDDD